MQTFRIIVNQTSKSYNVTVNKIIRSYVVQANGYKWKSLGDKGTDGIDGKSTYELAVDNGFVGTLDAFLLSQKGKDGYTPIKGVDYTDGEKGTDGYTPIKGQDYFDGATPIKGVDYFDGAEGASPYVGGNGNWWTNTLGDTGINPTGPQGIPGDPTLLIDDTQLLLDKTFSSQHIDNTYEKVIAVGTDLQYLNGLKQWVTFPNIPAQVQSNWNAISGPSLILNKPTLFDGNYNSLSNRPTLFSGSYTDLSNKPIIPNAQVQTDWNAITGIGVLLNKPTLFDGNYNSLSNKPSLFDGNYNSLSNKPSIPTVPSWALTTDKPSYSWTEIVNRPTSLSQFTNNLGNYGNWITGITTSMVINALGYVPWSSVNHPTTLTGYGITDIPWTNYLPLSGGTLSGALILKEGATNGLRFPNDAFTGGGDTATITLENPSGGEATRMTFTMTNDADDLFSFVAPSVNGMLMNGNIVWNAGNFNPASKLDYRTFGSAAYNNTSDFYAVGSTVANSTLWNNNTYNAAIADSNLSVLMGRNTYTGEWTTYSPTTIKTFLGLGSSAYTNTNDHILNQNSSAQSANMWISGDIKSASITFPTTGYALIGENYFYRYDGTTMGLSGNFKTTGAATFASTVNAGNDIHTNANLTLNSDSVINYNSSVNSSYRIYKLSGSINSYFESGGPNIFNNIINTTQLQSTVATGTAPLIVNSTTMVGNLNAQYLNGMQQVQGQFANGTSSDGTFNSPAGHDGYGNIIRTNFGGGYYTDILVSANSNALKFRTVNASIDTGWRTVWDSSNLTNNLSTNYLPKWNGGSMVNSLISDDGNFININSRRFSKASSTSIILFSGGSGGLTINNNADSQNIITFADNGNITMYSTTASTSPTNGALVVNGGMGVGGNLNIGGYITLNQGNDIYFGNRVGGSYGIGQYYDGTALNFYNGFGGSNFFTISRATGNATIGYNADQGYKLAVNGTGYFSGNVILNGDVHCGNIIATSSNSNFISSDVNIGYDSYQGYKLAVNGGGFYNGDLVVGNTSSPRTILTNNICGYGGTGTLNINPWGGSVFVNGGNSVIHSGNIGSQTVSNLMNSGGGGIQSSVLGQGYNYAVCIREPLRQGGNNAAEAAPRLGFHWGGIVASSISIGTNGAFYFNNNPGTGRETVYMGALISSDTGYFNGNLTASNFILSSDRTLKTNIQPIIKDYSRLNLVSFNFKDNLNELRFGTIAQDLLSNGYSEFVTGDKEGEYKVKYIDLIIAKLASAESRIKELEEKYGSSKY